MTKLSKSVLVEVSDKIITDDLTLDQMDMLLDKFVDTILNDHSFDNKIQCLYNQLVLLGFWGNHIYGAKERAYTAMKFVNAVLAVVNAYVSNPEKSSSWMTKELVEKLVASMIKVHDYVKYGELNGKVY